MKRKAIMLLLAAVLLSGFAHPLPECYLTKVNCPRKANGACQVFAGQCESAKSACGKQCPLSQSLGQREKEQTCYELLSKIKSYPVRSLLTLAPDGESARSIVADASLVIRTTLQGASCIQSVNGCERASPIFLQDQSFLF
jgi:hypothetical protein